MVSQSHSGDLIADRYASALYELASESKLVDEVLKDLNLLQSMLKNNKNLLTVINSPLITSFDKATILNKLLLSMKANKLTLTFLKVIEKNKRFSIIQIRLLVLKIVVRKLLIYFQKCYKISTLLFLTALFLLLQLFLENKKTQLLWLRILGLEIKRNLIYLKRIGIKLNNNI